MKVTIYHDASLAYYNRIIRADLPTEGGESFENINFIQGNGITTSLTLNIANNTDSVISPTYLHVETGLGGDYEDQYWFVMSCNRERSNQITLLLRRDFFRNSFVWDNIQDSPFMVEKSAKMPDSIAYARYTKSMNLSQVKSESIELGENYLSVGSLETNRGKGFIVMYIAKNSLPGQTITAGFFTITFPSDEIYQGTWDAPYDVVALPVLGNFTCTDDDGDTFTSNLDFNLAQRIVMELNNKLSSKVYDIQYVPYLPINITSSTTLVQDTYSGGVITQTDVISATSTKVGMFLVLQYAQGSWILPRYPYSSKITEYNNLSSNMEKRIYGEEHMWRLVSPNYASEFEFSVIKNDGFPTTFYVDVALKPYSPFIYVYFNFDGLYGKNFEDGRGLILSGDFSLAQITNAWSDYQIQNKNYQAIFDRQIQTLDLKNTYADQLATQAEVKSVGSAIGSTAGGALGGFATGHKYGGLVGGVVGAVVGGVSGATAGVYNSVTTFQNMQSEKAIRDDERQALIDNYQYQLGNIQAIPLSLTKVSSINPVFKVFPQIEIYECTEQEKENLENSIKYNGIDINLIAKLSDFDSGFIKGSLLYCPNLSMLSYEQFQYLNSELEQGVYLKEVS